MRSGLLLAAFLVACKRDDPPIRPDPPKLVDAAPRPVVTDEAVIYGRVLDELGGSKTAPLWVIDEVEPMRCDSAARIETSAPTMKSDTIESVMIATSVAPLPSTVVPQRPIEVRPRTKLEEAKSAPTSIVVLSPIAFDATRTDAAVLARTGPLEADGAHPPVEVRLFHLVKVEGRWAIRETMECPR